MIWLQVKKKYFFDIDNFWLGKSQISTSYSWIAKQNFKSNIVSFSERLVISPYDLSFWKHKAPDSDYWTVLSIHIHVYTLVLGYLTILYPIMKGGITCSISFDVVSKLESLLTVRDLPKVESCYGFKFCYDVWRVELIVLRVNC